MGTNEDYLDSLLKSVADEEIKGNDVGNSLNMDSLLADIESLDLETLDLEALDLGMIGEIPVVETAAPADTSENSNLEEALTMTQEEIEQLLRETQAASEEPAESKFNMDSDDLTALLSGLDGEAGESGDEISDLLKKADNNEVIDENMAERMSQEEAFDDSSDLFLANLGEESEPKKKGLFDLFAKKKNAKEDNPSEEGEKEEKSKKKKEKPVKEKKKSRKAKKQEAAKEEAAEQEEYIETLEIVEVEDSGKKEKPAKEKASKEKKKKGLGSKFAALFAEEEDEDSADAILATLQKQNDAILMEMAEEDGAAAKIKEKPSKKKDKKKDKDKKKEKKKKEEKTKKEKKPKKEKITVIEPKDEEPKKYFPVKKAGTIVFVCVMLMAAFLVLNTTLVNHSIGIKAAQAFNDEQYMECYQLLSGHDRTEEQDVMFNRSEMILKMRLYKQHCNEYLNAGQELEAVDKLVQFVYDYEKLWRYATENECADIVESTYGEVTAALLSYGVTAEEAIAIAKEPFDAEYTRALLQIVEGTHLKEESVLEPIFKDMLPEEAGRQP